MNSVKQIILSVLLVLFQFGLMAQDGSPTAAGAAGIAMGNTGVAHSGINSIFSNQAGLANLTNIEATVFGEQRFLISEIRLLNAGVALPTKTGVFGLQIQYFGFELYNQQKIGLAFAKKLSKNFSLGAQIDYLNTSIQEYGNASTLTFELGAQAELLKDLLLAVHVYSPVSAKINEDFSIPTILKIGLGYTISEKVFTTVEVEYDVDYNPAVKLGLQYALVDDFYLRLGGSTNPTLVSFGLGYTKNIMSIDVASAFHQSLGFMPAISASFQFNK